jgi:hypothetical protein
MAIPASSQDSSLPDNPDPANYRNSSLQASFVPQRNEKLLDAHFLLMATSDMGLSLADSAVSSTYVSNNPGCYESDFLYGSFHPSSTRYFVQASLTSAGAIGLSYLLRKKHSRFWTLPVAVDGFAHFEGVMQTVSSCKNRQWQ